MNPELQLLPLAGCDTDDGAGIDESEMLDSDGDPRLTELDGRDWLLLDDGAVWLDDGRLELDGEAALDSEEALDDGRLLELPMLELAAVTQPLAWHG